MLRVIFVSVFCKKKLIYESGMARNYQQTNLMLTKKTASEKAVFFTIIFVILRYKATFAEHRLNEIF